MDLHIKNPRIRRFLFFLAVAVSIGVVVAMILLGRHYFSRRVIRQMSSMINSYGIWAPFAVIFLIVLSTAIPPLPLPVPLIEIAAGLLFGFWPGFLLVWFSQILSSLIAFAMIRMTSLNILRVILNNRLFIIYRRFVDAKGAIGIFVTRATFAAPFNIVSFIAGLTHMSLLSFFTATAFGTIPESLLYPFLGSIISLNHIRLWYIYIAIVILSSIVPMYIFTQLNKALFIKSRKRKK